LSKPVMIVSFQVLLSTESWN